MPASKPRDWAYPSSPPPSCESLEAPSPERPMSPAATCTGQLKPSLLRMVLNVEAGTEGWRARLMAAGRPRWTMPSFGRSSRSRRVPMVGVGGADNHESARCGPPAPRYFSSPGSRACYPRWAPGADRGQAILLEVTVKPNGARSGRNPRFCLNTPTIAAYPRIFGLIGDESRAAQSRLSCGIEADGE